MQSWPASTKFAGSRWQQGRTGYDSSDFNAVEMSSMLHHSALQDAQGRLLWPYSTHIWLMMTWEHAHTVINIANRHHPCGR